MRLVKHCDKLNRIGVDVLSLETSRLGWLEQLDLVEDFALIAGGLAWIIFKDLFQAETLYGSNYGW